MMKTKKVVDIHFGSMGWSGTERDSPEALPRGVHEAMQSLFRVVKERHPEAEKVEGDSWLFTRLLQSPQYRVAMQEIFPPAFLASAHLVRNEGRGGGMWGQFIDNKGQINMRRVAEFRKRMNDPEIMTGKNLMTAFPIQATMLTAPIEDFYKFYGIE